MTSNEKVPLVSVMARLDLSLQSRIAGFLHVLAIIDFRRGSASNTNGR